VLEKLPRQTPSQILEKYRLNFPKINEDQPTEIARYRERINIFNVFLTKALINMAVSYSMTFYLFRLIETQS
jgi:hypothetical protein